MTGPGAERRAGIARLVAGALALGLWFAPVPEGLVPAAWHLFALFVAAIVSVVIGAFPILTASVLALAAAVLTGTLAPAQAYSGFANGTILLIVVAFLVARAVVKCGLGERLGHVVVSVFGRSTLGLGYSVFLVDGVIAPAFPSNTARSGVLYPLVLSVAEAAGARPGRAGPAAAGQLPDVLGHGEPHGLVGALVHGHGGEPARGRDRPRPRSRDRLRLVARRVLGADARRDGAPAARALQGHRARGHRDARGARAPPGGRSRRWARCAPTRRSWPRRSWAWWSSGGRPATLGLDSTAVAFLGLGVLLATGVLTLGDIAKEGDVLATFIWFAVLFTLSGQLNELGFMGFLGERLAGALGGLSARPGRRSSSWSPTSCSTTSSSARRRTCSRSSACSSTWASSSACPWRPLAFLLLFATNFFSANTPQGSSANLLFAGSGYLSQGELYRLGALTTAFNLAVYLVGGHALAPVSSNR